MDDIEALTALAISLASLLNLGVMWYQTKKRIPTEVHKQKAEAAESISEGAESNSNAAKISNDLLLERIAELKKDRSDRDKYIAVLKKIMTECGLPIPEFNPDAESKL